MLEEKPSANLIVPRIALNLPKAVLPDIVLSNEDSPVERAFVADLFILYAFDQPMHFTMVAQRDLARLDLDKSHLHNIALTNLRERIPQPEFHNISAGVFMLTCGGNFEAATLLMDEVWQQAAEMVNGALIVAVPARDLIIFTGSENRDGLAFMRSRVSRVLETGDHILTRHFLIRYENGWILYEGYAA